MSGRKKDGFVDAPEPSIETIFTRHVEVSLREMNSMVRSILRHGEGNIYYLYRYPLCAVIQ